MDSMHDVKRQIKELRPGLRLVAPMTWYITLGFGIMNVALGLALMFYQLGIPLAVVSRFTPLSFYGALFVIHGLATLLNLYKNNWTWLKALLVVGILIKSIWLFALILRLFAGGSAIILTLWLFLTYIQVITYIYFIPAKKQDISNG